MKNKFDRKVFERPKFPLGDILTWIAIIFLVYVCVVFCVFSNYFEAVSVKGRSMLPTYNSSGGEDTVYVHKGDYNYGDIVIIKLEGKSIIKRVIGLGGDRIELKFVNGEYRVFRNDTMLEEDYIYSISGNISTYHNLRDYKNENPECFEGNTFVVGENQIFALGDNRGDSRDSSYYGAFDVSQISGKVYYSVDSNSNRTLSIFFQIFFPFFYK